MTSSCFILLQDKTLWEDLCQLEGQLGMRYLTHETEDNFWTTHGANPHPLAKAEAEEKTQIKLEQEQALESSHQSRVNFALQSDQLSNGSLVSNGSAVLGNSSVFSDSSEQDKIVNSSRVSSKEGGSGDTSPSIFDLGPPGEPFPPQETQEGVGKTRTRKDYVSMSDEDIRMAQDHAIRVGYKVSTV